MSVCIYERARVFAWLYIAWAIGRQHWICSRRLSPWLIAVVIPQTAARDSLLSSTMSIRQTTVSGIISG